MAEVRLIDANALKENRRGYYAFVDKITGKWPCVLLAEIGRAPTIDAVEVVRCKDCKFYEVHGKKDASLLMTWKTRTRT